MFKKIAFVAMLALSASAHAIMVTIDPGSFASSTDLGSPFPGVTMATAEGYVNFVDFDPTPTLVETIHLTGATTGSIFAAGAYFASANHANWASDPQFGRNEVMLISFTVPVDYVSMTYIPDDTDTGVLGVFDTNGNLIFHDYDRAGHTFTLDYQAQSPSIAYVLAGTADPAYLGAFSFNYFDVPATAVFEPDTLPLFALGLLCVVFARTRARKSC